MIGHKFVEDGKGGIVLEDWGLDGSVFYTYFDADDIIRIKELIDTIEDKNRKIRK